MLGTKELRQLREVARKFRMSPWTVVLLAAAEGPRGWRGCVNVTTYKPQKNGNSSTHKHQAWSLI
ncbi:MAG: hypothetical protein IKG21_12830 [Atopobiaceae bacterium]|nr:hypothetical protein [Atopobiaceae bacterium]